MVYFVGAGSGAEDLITVRGMHLLEKADVVIYAGSLVNPGILKYCKDDCEIHDSSKLHLDEVINIIKEAESKGLTTVRLHTGEPSLYGAVREQMDELDRSDIRYESCPGVTAAFGAAASLDLEYTLPGISQSLIITRMEGRTAVPEGESIESLAGHHSSMAIYLSTGMLERLSAKLISGGYSADTPAAIVYKATWPDEKKVICTVGTLAESAESEGIKKTAIVLVGDVIRKKNYERSKLYDPAFTTEFRKGTDQTDAVNTKDRDAEDTKKLYGEAAVISFTDRGYEAACTLKEKVRGSFSDISISSAMKNRPDHADRDEWTVKQFEDKKILIFIGAVGIAVRSIAPHIKDKLHDSPVIVLDEELRCVIPLLSGHIGGANEIAGLIAKKTGAYPVITTASDLKGAFASDMFAQNNYLKIINKNGIAAVTGKALTGADIIVSADKGTLPDGRALLFLTPKKYVVGIGCRKGKSFEELEDFFMQMQRETGIEDEDIAAIVSINDKKEEAGIIRLAQYHRCRFITFSADELKTLEGDFNSSEFVLNTVGVDNVCERSALYFCNNVCSNEGRIIYPKHAKDGITMAVAERVM
ncbi:MAG: precorrin-4 C(11)-methyltransferase [Lachnospiraceae bacterium]|nr:precorrin-4 C(11)-methyltransferase [Lachnospiraceae bacterium]